MGNITPSNYDKFAEQMNQTNTLKMWANSKDSIDFSSHPGVDVNCIHGTELNTTEQLVYKERKDFPNSPTVINGPGDGTVNLISLRKCLDWSKEKKFQFDYKTFPKVKHLDMVSNAEVIGQVLSHLITE